MPPFRRSEIHARILPLLPALVADWAFADQDDSLTEQTLLGADLGLTSVEFIDLFVAIERDLGRTIGFHDLLMVDGRYIADLSLGRLTDFLYAKLAVAEQPDPPPSVGRTPRPAPGQPTLDADRIARFRAIIPCPPPWPAPMAKNRRAVFVLSAPRSGSTLLQTILAGHPALFAPPELHLLWFDDLQHRRLAFSSDSNRHLTSGAIRAIMALDGLSVDDASAFLARCEAARMPITAFYGLLQQRLGTRLLVDKTPANAYSTAVLARAEQAFEAPLYLQLVRHPGGMARSFADARLERTVPFMQRHADEFTSLEFAELAWLTCNQNIGDFLDGIPADRRHRVHYEDLVTAPAATLQEIRAFLGLDPHPGMLDPYRDKAARMADGLHRVDQMSGDLKFHLHGGIDPDAAERWRRFLSEDALSAATWSLAGRLGYRRRDREAGPS